MDTSAFDSARIVGLWLAEGDKKTPNEVTFTNNHPPLMRLFHDTLWEQFRPRNLPRIYVYHPSPSTGFILPVAGVRYRTYVDRRARKPYYIYSVADAQLVRDWKMLVRAVCNSPTNYQGLLQGFFAGGGNIKEEVSGHSRSLRIAQGKSIALVESMLLQFGVSFRCHVSERSYVITGRENLEMLQRIGISDLHSIKHARFLEISAIVGRDRKSVSTRLAEPGRLNPVEKVNPNWCRIQTSKRVIVR